MIGRDTEAGSFVVVNDGCPDVEARGRALRTVTRPFQGASGRVVLVDDGSPRFAAYMADWLDPARSADGPQASGQPG